MWRGCWLLSLAVVWVAFPLGGARVATAQPASDLTYEENVNRNGHHLTEFNLVAADPRLCQKNCIDNRQCTAWVYRKPAGRTDGKPHCWLLDRVTKIDRGDTMLVSGKVRPEVPLAQGGAIKEVFERHNLLGVFAWNCMEPASKQNNFYVHRLNRAGQVQRDIMEGPEARSFVVMIDQAAEANPDEISVSGAANGRPFSSTFRIEANRMRVVEGTFDGKVLVVDGRGPSGKGTPWATKCDPDTQ